MDYVWSLSSRKKINKLVLFKKVKKSVGFLVVIKLF